MQTLGLATRLFPIVVSGEKTSTIRWRETRMFEGLMRYVCDGDETRTVDVMVMKCTDMPLSAVAAYLGKLDDWPDEVMLEGMREHYPEIKLTDTVQVVEHSAPLQSD